MLTSCESLYPKQPVLSSPTTPAVCTAHSWLLSWLGNPWTAWGLCVHVHPRTEPFSGPTQGLLDLYSLLAKQTNPTVLHSVPDPVALPCISGIREEKETAWPPFSLSLLHGGQASFPWKCAWQPLHCRTRLPFPMWIP